MELMGKVNNGVQSVSRAGMSSEICEEGKPAIDMVAAPMCMEGCISHMLTLEVEERAVDFPSLSAFLGNESEGTFEKVCMSLGDMRYGYIEIVRKNCPRLKCG